MALNDESKDVRATAVQLVGRLAAWNPAYVAPALRRHLLQLLTDMDHSPDSKQRDDSAYLLNCLINSAPQLIMPYISPIQKVGVLVFLQSCGCRPVCMKCVHAEIEKSNTFAVVVELWSGAFGGLVDGRRPAGVISF